MLHLCQGDSLESLLKGLPTRLFPLLVNHSFEEIGISNIPEMFQGMFFLEIVAPWPNVVNKADCQCFLSNRDSPHEMLDRIDDFISKDHEFRRNQVAMVHPAAAVMNKSRSDGSCPATLE